MNRRTMKKNMLGLFIFVLGAIKTLLTRDSISGHRAGLALIILGRAILTKTEREADLVAKQILTRLEVSELERGNK